MPPSLPGLRSQDTQAETNYKDFTNQNANANGEELPFDHLDLISSNPDETNPPFNFLELEEQENSSTDTTVTHQSLKHEEPYFGDTHGAY